MPRTVTIEATIAASPERVFEELESRVSPRIDSNITAYEADRPTTVAFVLGSGGSAVHGTFRVQSAGDGTRLVFTSSQPASNSFAQMLWPIFGKRAMKKKLAEIKASCEVPAQTAAMGA